MKNATVTLMSVLLLGTASMASAGGLNPAACEEGEVQQDDGSCVGVVVAPTTTRSGVGVLPLLAGAAVIGGIIAVAVSGGSSSTTTTNNIDG